MSLREKQSARRRSEMLDAAELLIRQGGSTEFSMRTLATTAEVSPATPYNFFGSKEGLLFALLERSLESFMSEALDVLTTDPLERIVEAADRAVVILLRDPVLLRPLYQVMLGLSDPVHHPTFLEHAFQFYAKALDPAVERGLVDQDERLGLAATLMAHVMGVLDLWVHEDIEDAWFRAQVNYGVSHLLWPLARGKTLAKLKARRDAARAALAGLKPQALFGSIHRHGGKPGAEAASRRGKS